jgi:hypothetical protein
MRKGRFSKLLALHYSLEGWQAGMPSEILFLQRRVGNVSRPLFTPVLYDDSKKQTGDVAMNWDAIGAMGEVVGAVAVVITMLSEPGGKDFWKKIGQFGVHDALGTDETSYQMF